jgi:hypothetical protein
MPHPQKPFRADVIWRIAKRKSWTGLEMRINGKVVQFRADIARDAAVHFCMGHPGNLEG